MIDPPVSFDIADEDVSINAANTVAPAAMPMQTGVVARNPRKAAEPTTASMFGPE
jgi:hypothetical protein